MIDGSGNKIGNKTNDRVKWSIYGRPNTLAHPECSRLDRNCHLASTLLAADPIVDI
jgi:hypothetical protein